MTRKRLRRWVLVGIPIVLLLLYFAVAWSLSSLIVAPPPRSLADVCELAAIFPDCSPENIVPQLVAQYHLPEPETVELTTADGLPLVGWYFDSPDDGNCAMLLLHGYRMNRLEPAVVFAEYFNARGCDLLAYDGRANGESGGDYITYGYYESPDALLALDWLAARADLPVAQIGLAGSSLGAATALLTALEQPEVAFVIAESAYADLPGIFGYQAEARYGPFMRWLFLDAGMLLARWRGNFDPGAVAPVDFIGQVAPPVLLIHSLQDDFTPAAHSEALAAAADPAQTALRLTDWNAGHAASCYIRAAACHEYFDAFLAAFAPDFGRVVIGADN